MSRSAAAAALFGAVMRMISQPASASRTHWASVAFTSSVSEVVIDCTRMGLAPPMPTPPARTSRVARRTARVREVQ